MAKGDSQVAIGRNQARLSREGGHTGTDVLMSKKAKRKAKLHLGAAAAENLVLGTMKKNQNTDSNN